MRLKRKNLNWSLLQKVSFADFEKVNKLEKSVEMGFDDDELRLKMMRMNFDVRIKMKVDGSLRNSDFQNWNLALKLRGIRLVLQRRHSVGREGRNEG